MTTGVRIKYLYALAMRGKFPIKTIRSFGYVCIFFFVLKIDTLLVSPLPVSEWSVRAFRQLDFFLLRLAPNRPRVLEDVKLDDFFPVCLPETMFSVGNNDYRKKAV